MDENKRLNTTVQDIESAVRDLARQPVLKAYQVEDTWSNALTKQLEDALSKTTMAIIQRSQTLRTELEDMEKALHEHFIHVNKGILEHISHADNLLQAAKMVADEMQAMREKMDRGGI